MNSDVLQQENRQLSEPNLHQTTLPIDLKASVSQLVALELTKHSEDSKIHNKALAWLKSPPTATQLGWVITATPLPLSNKFSQRAPGTSFPEVTQSFGN